MRGTLHDVTRRTLHLWIVVQPTRVSHVPRVWLQQYLPPSDTLLERPTFDDAQIKLPGFALFHLDGACCAYGVKGLLKSRPRQQYKSLTLGGSRLAACCKKITAHCRLERTAHGCQEAKEEGSRSLWVDPGGRLSCRETNFKCTRPRPCGLLKTADPKLSDGQVKKYAVIANRHTHACAVTALLPARKWQTLQHPCVGGHVHVTAA